MPHLEFHAELYSFSIKKPLWYFTIYQIVNYGDTIKSHSKLLFIYITEEMSLIINTVFLLIRMRDCYCHVTNFPQLPRVSAERPRLF